MLVEYNTVMNELSRAEEALSQLVSLARMLDKEVHTAADELRDNVEGMDDFGSLFDLAYTIGSTADSGRIRVRELMERTKWSYAPLAPLPGCENVQLQQVNSIGTEDY